MQVLERSSGGNHVGLVWKKLTVWLGRMSYVCDILKPLLFKKYKVCLKVVADQKRSKYFLWTVFIWESHGLSACFPFPYYYYQLTALPKKDPSLCYFSNPSSPNRQTKTSLTNVQARLFHLHLHLDLSHFPLFDCWSYFWIHGIFIPILINPNVVVLTSNCLLLLLVNFIPIFFHTY